MFRDLGAGAGLGNFWKRWVRVRRDSAIKKLLKIFLFIFSIYFYIKIFLKNTYYALIHKKRKKKASFGFSDHIQGRFRPFQACFSHIGRRPIWLDMADTARFWPNHPGSMQIRERKKKKKTADAVRRAGNHVPRHTTSDAGAAPLVPHPCFLDENTHLI